MKLKIVGLVLIFGIYSNGLDAASNSKEDAAGKAASAASGDGKDVKAAEVNSKDEKAHAVVCDNKRYDNFMKSSSLEIHKDVFRGLLHYRMYQANREDGARHKKNENNIAKDAAAKLVEDFVDPAYNMFDFGEQVAGPVNCLVNFINSWFEGVIKDVAAYETVLDRYAADQMAYHAKDSKEGAALSPLNKEDLQTYQDYLNKKRLKRHIDSMLNDFISSTLENRNTEKFVKVQLNKIFTAGVYKFVAMHQGYSAQELIPHLRDFIKIQLKTLLNDIYQYQKLLIDALV